MSGPISVIKKICLLGDPAVGKTSLIRRYVFDEFDDTYITTIGTKVTKKALEMKCGDKTYKLSMLIWDILGQKEFMAFHKTYYQGAEGALLVCDATRAETQQSLLKWIESFTGAVGTVPMIFLVNKSDLVNKEEFDKSFLVELSKTHNTQFMFTSAREGLNVEAAFLSMGKRLLPQ